MPTVTITWDDINDNEDGFNIYRDTVPLDTANPANLPTPLDTVAAGIGTYEDTTAAADTTYYYAVAAVKGSFVNAAGEVEVATAAPILVGNATVGDYTEGGVYAGIYTLDGTDWHLISGDEASEAVDIQWKTSQTSTAGTLSTTDGLANTDAMVAAGIADHPAAQHCVNYTGGGFTDWYMPAREQVAALYFNLNSHPEFADIVASGDFLWSSSELDATRSWLRIFSSDYQAARAKDNVAGYRVRPIRRVVVDPDYSTLSIGDEAGGGIYAGIDTIDGADYYIVAGKAESEEYGLQWKTSNTATAGTDSDTDGLANTLAMEAAGLADHPAAAHCLAYGGGGRSDWHMPARSQLTLLYNNLAGHAEFADNVSSLNLTWYSTEISNSKTGGRRFSDGYESTNMDKDGTLVRTRPIRRIPVNP